MKDIFEAMLVGMAFYIMVILSMIITWIAWGILFGGLK